MYVPAHHAPDGKFLFRFDVHVWIVRVGRAQHRPIRRVQQLFGGGAKPAAGAAGVAGAQQLRVQTTSAVADTPRREAEEAATDAELSTPSREADAQAGDAGVADAESPGGGASPTSDCDDDLDELLANAQSVMATAEAATARLLEQRDRLQLGDARTPQSDEDE